jgi:hypothetical protein
MPRSIAKPIVISLMVATVVFSLGRSLSRSQTLSTQPTDDAAQSQTASVQFIHIDSTWEGLPGDRDDYHVEIRRSEKGFVSGAMPVSVTNVARLFGALQAPAVRTVSAAALGATKAWLSANAERAFESYVRFDGMESQGFYTAAQRALYIRSFENPALVSDAIAAIYNSGARVADDDIDISVTIGTTHEQTWSAHSKNQATLMLPWRVIAGDRTFVTFNADISEAIRDLLPPKANRYGRLTKATLLASLSGIVAGYITPEWEKLPQYDVRPQLATLERRYNVSITHSAGGPTSRNPGWDADLRWPDLPSYAVATVRIPIVNNAFGDSSSIPAAKRMLKATMAIPWVSRYLAGHPGVTLRLYVDTVGTPYFKAEDQAAYISDMTALGYLRTLSRVRAELGAAFEVTFEDPRYNFSSWLVLPDQTMALYTYEYDPTPKPILDLDPRLVAGKQCPTHAYMCAGLVRLPNGEIEP